MIKPHGLWELHACDVMDGEIHQPFWMEKAG